VDYGRRHQHRWGSIAAAVADKQGRVLTMHNGPQ
jgi:hypothetical protein